MFFNFLTNLRVGTKVPNLKPTRFKSTCTFLKPNPLWTKTFLPIKVKGITDHLDHIFKAFLESLVFKTLKSKKGPFHFERLIKQF